MKLTHTKHRLFRRIVLWAAIGFAIMVALGPIMVLLTFAALGFVVWMLVQSLYFGRERAWQRTQILARTLGAGLLAAATWGFAQLSIALHKGARSFYQHGGVVAGRAWRMTRQHGRFLGALLLETLGGASVGGLIAYAIVLAGGGEPARPAVIGALIGAFLGALVAISRHEPAVEPTIRS